MKVRKQEPLTENTLLVSPLPETDPHENKFVLHLILITGQVALSVVLWTTKELDAEALAKLLEQLPLPQGHIKRTEAIRLLTALSTLKKAGHLLEYTPF